MKARRLIIGLLLVLWGLNFSAQAKETITACGHHDYPPWNWQKGNQIIGACAEVIQTLFGNVGLNVDMTFVGPWVRCQSQIKSGEVDVNICAFINDDRKVYSRFIQTPMGFNENAIFTKKGNEFSFLKWDDLKEKKQEWFSE